MRPRGQNMARRSWTEASRNHLPIRTDAQLRAAADDGVRRWQHVNEAMDNANTPEEHAAADALFRQIVADEDSGMIPFEPVEFPEYMPLPEQPGDVVAISVPTVPRRKR
jgi:hypothetical protein